MLDWFSKVAATVSALLHIKQSIGGPGGPIQQPPPWVAAKGRTLGVGPGDLLLGLPCWLLLQRV